MICSAFRSHLTYNRAHFMSYHALSFKSTLADSTAPIKGSDSVIMTQRRNPNAIQCLLKGFLHVPSLSSIKFNLLIYSFIYLNLSHKGSEGIFDKVHFENYPLSIFFGIALNFRSHFLTGSMSSFSKISDTQPQL